MTMTRVARERPILFTGPMVRAVLDGSKTQTRRVVKPQPVGAGLAHRHSDGMWSFFEGPALESLSVGSGPRRCPYGVPGDLLYVRETWRPYSWHEDRPLRLEYKAGGPRHDCDSELDHEDWEERQWIAIRDELVKKGFPLGDDGLYHFDEDENPLRWRPSIHLPKCGSRLWLRVTDVRVERVQDISENPWMWVVTFERVESP